MIEIYTDGACLGNPGPGGWGAVIIEDGIKRTLSGADESTTNNRMEMLAVIQGLASVPESEPVTVFSDSQYVVNTMTRGWKRKANLDLWDRLDAEVAAHRVEWRWVRGHAGDPGNEEADSLATAAARGDTNPGSPGLSHVDDTGKAAMVDVGGKEITLREAIAKGSVLMRPETLALIKANAVNKGDVLGVARVAGIMAAKNTSQLIPLCHPLPLDQVSVDFDLDAEANAVIVTTTARTTAKTGVEMEALTAVAVAALTIYDMCKSADRAMKIDAIRLVSKSGGRSGDINLE
jgi:cyclic pyranopterin phosphate synthase